MANEIINKKQCNALKIYWNEDYLRSQLENGKNYLDVSRDNNIGKSTAQRALKQYKLTKRRLDWTNREVSHLLIYYGKIRKFKKHFAGRSLCSIYHKAHKLGLVAHIKYRKYSVNENFFKKWSNGMAYVLGWMFSDGNVTPDKRTFRIKLSARDVEVLRKLKSIMKTNSPIKISVQQLPSKKGFAYYAGLCVHSRTMCEDLSALGCTPNKTKRSMFPRMPSCVTSHFVRGFFDGDGSISFNHPNTIKIRLVSSNENFIKWLADILEQQLGIPAKYKSVRENFWQTDYYGDNARRFCNWIYASCGSYYLKRKRVRYMNYLVKRGNHV